MTNIKPIYNWPREEKNPSPAQSYFKALEKAGWLKKDEVKNASNSNRATPWNKR
jgi:hypothetical protein